MKSLNARLHLTTMRDADWRWGDIARTEYSDWQQVAGDVNSSVFGATFARVSTDYLRDDCANRKSLEMIQVTNLETDTGEPANKYGPYLVEASCLTPWDLGHQKAMFDQLVATYGSDADVDTDTLLLMVGQEIASHWGMEGDDLYASLGDAMAQHNIPAAALWEPSNANHRFQWGPECRLLSDEHIFPRDNHAKRLAIRIYQEWRDGVGGYALDQLRAHLAKVVAKMYADGDDVPDWYGKGTPTAKWASLETF